jgi:hypothetical protein
MYLAAGLFGGYYDLSWPKTALPENRFNTAGSSTSDWNDVCAEFRLFIW